MARAIIRPVTTTEASPTRIFADARRMHSAALERMASGDIRDAAEKAWCATVRAAEALVMARTGEGPSTSTAAGRRLRVVSRTDPALRDLRRIYIERQTILHGECFYHDDCEPDETRELIRETVDFIRGAEALAEA